MGSAAQPLDIEARRLDALKHYGIPDTDTDSGLQRIVGIAARQLDAPIAMVSLLGDDRVRFLARHGFEIHEADREDDLSSQAIARSDILVVPDMASGEAPACGCALAADPGIRFYAAAPIVTPDGHAIGALAVAGPEPRADFGECESRLLGELAALAMDRIEARYGEPGPACPAPATDSSAGSMPAQLEQFFRDVPGAVAMFDRQMRYLACSQPWSEMFGLDRGRLNGRRLATLSPHLGQDWQAHYAGCLDGEHCEIAEDTLPLAEGGFHWVRRKIWPWYEPDGRIGGLMEFIELIDEQKHATSALEQSHRFTEAVLAHVSDGIVACDNEGKLTIINETARRLAGADANDGALREGSMPLAGGSNGIPLHELGRAPLVELLRSEGRVNGEDWPDSLDENDRAVVTRATSIFAPDGARLGTLLTMRDETDERLALDRWRRANARYRAIFDHTFQFCGLLDDKGNVVDINEPALKFSGQKREDVVGKPFWNAHWGQMGEETRSRLKAAIAQALLGDFIRYELELQDAAGDPVPMDFSINPVLDDEGNIANLIVEARDISAIRESELELRRKQSELELVLNTVPVAIFYKKAGGRILRANETAARALGMPLEDIEGSTDDDLFVNGADRFAAHDHEIILSGKPRFGLVEEFVSRSGAHGWWRIDKVPHTDPSTGEQYIFVAATDISAEKKAEHAHQASEQRYRRLYNGTPVMMHTADADGRLLSVSDFWLEKLGYSREEVLGRRSTEFLLPESAEKAINEVLPEFWRTGICKDVEYRIRTKSGEVMDVLLSAVAERDAAGRFRRKISVLTDITERKVVERQLFQAQKMESVGQLTGGLAHDFNNLLGVIMGNLQLVEPMMGGNERARKRVSAALNAVSRGAELTKRLLAFSRRQQLVTEVVAPNPLISNLIEIMERSLGEKVKLQCELDDAIPLVWTDPSQFESAILNLAVNARDAMPNGGTLTVQSTVTQLAPGDPLLAGELTPGQYVIVTVSDTGSGIPEDRIAHVFEPFYTTKETGRGSGLGLSMVYGFMKQSGGHVHIDSVLGLGTVVKLVLPAALDEPISAFPSRAPVFDEELEATGTVLVVEDQSDVREVAVALFEELGFNVIEETTGRSGLALLRTGKHVDLLFTDIIMPGGVDGIELAEQARTMRPDLPIIFATGYADARALGKSRIVNSRNLVTKPYERAELAQAVKHALIEQQDLARSA